MEWQDDAIVLSGRPHGDTGTIVELFTRDHGRHLGLVRGRRSIAGVVQPGNLVRAVWRARLADHLGTYRLELVRARIGALMDDADALTALRSLCALAAATLPEREPHAGLFEATSVVVDHLTSGAGTWPALLVRWELGLLEELGYGLDLTACAVTGARDDLVYVSPRTGRAVSRPAGAELADRLLRLPQFLLGSQAGQPDRDEIAAGFRLTGHFLTMHLQTLHGKGLPAARLELAARFRSSSTL